MGASCKCSSSLSSLNAAEIVRRNTLSPSIQNKEYFDQKLGQQLNEINQIDSFFENCPSKVVIIYPEKGQDFERLKQQLEEINKNNKYVIQEYRQKTEEINQKYTHSILSNSFGSSFENFML